MYTLPLPAGTAADLAPPLPPRLMLCASGGAASGGADGGGGAAGLDLSAVGSLHT